MDRWNKAIDDICWQQRPSAVLGERDMKANPYLWFPDGKLNTCYNAVDRHALTSPNIIALYWHSAVTKTKKAVTYQQLLTEVKDVAGVLADHGVRKGDTVVIYMPMILEAVYTMLACARIGAVHSVVFGGFAPKELAKRIDDCKPKVVVIASCGVEPKRVIPYKPLMDEALSLCQHKVPIRIVFQRPGFPLAQLHEQSGDRNFETEIERIQNAGKALQQCATVDSADTLYLLYTSGTTGMPKGVVRSNGGHAVALRWSMDYIFGLKKGDTIFTASDIGWVVGHTYIVYGPLLAGLSSVLYEGKPIGTPDASAFWRVCADYNVKAIFTAPTAIRAIRREDPEGKMAQKQDLNKLRALFLAGERSDPATINWCQKLLGKNKQVIDCWWLTETGQPVTSTCLGDNAELYPIKPGSAGHPVPGANVCVLKDDGTLVTTPNTFGNLAIKLPLVPAAFTTLWNNDKGYQDSYFKRFPGYFDTGDAGTIDEEGYVHVMSRTDDLINVAGHRLSTGSIEEILLSNQSVVETCCVPIPDNLKGHVPLALVVTSGNVPATLTKDLVAAVRKDLGAIACLEKVLVVARLPKTRSGKVLRRCIRDMCAGNPVNVPATVEDASVLTEIETALRKEGLIPEQPKAKL
ncbi:hypothetical protein INT43_005084 [Umbelopsis isabellina]|uniref:Uncharacterized protein n=1 Tax=Mortierella isabellina TaxID=91625 RepID=A0A8H7UBN2_MORIS|nr:hypothetical protein INT43_005084 [Umbelopsis isabellina]